MGVQSPSTYAIVVFTGVFSGSDRYGKRISSRHNSEILVHA
jgi:hypothetical protein